MLWTLYYSNAPPPPMGGANEGNNIPYRAPQHDTPTHQNGTQREQINISFGTPTGGGAYDAPRQSSASNDHYMPTRGGAYNTPTNTSHYKPQSINEVIVIPSIANINRPDFWDKHSAVYLKVCQ